MMNGVGGSVNDRQVWMDVVSGYRLRRSPPLSRPQFCHVTLATVEFQL